MQVFRDRINGHLKNNKLEIFERLDKLITELNRKTIKTNIYGQKSIILDYIKIKKKLEDKFDNI